MTVYNGEDYLREAIDSILKQTYTNFEVILVNDGSNDATSEIIRGYKDPRLKPIHLEHVGLVNALNAGISYCTGEFIARMDADDRALAERFAVQIEFFTRNANVDIVCSDIAIINRSGEISNVQRQSNIDSDTVRDAMLYRKIIKPIIHPSVMMRRKVLLELDGYRDFPAAEDHDLWLRAVDKFKFARISEILLEYRVHGAGISRTKRLVQTVSAVMSAVNYIVFTRCGVDMYYDKKDLFAQTLEAIQSELQNKVMGPSGAFRVARTKMMENNPTEGYFLLIGTILKYGFSALPMNTNAKMLKIVENASDRILKRLIETSV